MLIPEVLSEDSSFILKQPRWFYGISFKYIVTAAMLIQDTYVQVELLRCILTEYQYDRQALLLEDFL